MTVEDPIEFLHRDNQSIVNQREVAVDTRSFAQALRSALRQDPDVILVGEMRDFETIETALLAAETGHLVFSTLHTLDATETINRIIAVFPPHQQKQVRLQLASVLKAVISQRLMPRADGKGRAPAVEVMISTPFIRDCIVDKEKTHLIHGAIAAGHVAVRHADVRPVDLRPLRAGARVATRRRCAGRRNVDEFKLKVQGISTTSDMSRDQMAQRVIGGDARKSPRFGTLTRPAPVERRARAMSIAAAAYVDALKMLARRELSEAQVRAAPRAPRARRPTPSTPPSRGCVEERAIDDARVAAAIARTEAGIRKRAAGCASGARSRAPASPRDTARRGGRRGVRRRRRRGRCSRRRSPSASAAARRSPTSASSTGSIAISSARASNRDRVLGAAQDTERNRSRQACRPRRR